MPRVQYLFLVWNPVTQRNPQRPFTHKKKVAFGNFGGLWRWVKGHWVLTHANTHDQCMVHVCTLIFMEHVVEYTIIALILGDMNWMMLISTRHFLFLMAECLLICYLPPLEKLWFYLAACSILQAHKAGWDRPPSPSTTVDGWNPAPVDK